MKLLITVILRLRWGYFHVNPRYIKFNIDGECHFQDMKTNTILSDYVWVETKEPAQ